jgi:hypothetical protein
MKYARAIAIIAALAIVVLVGRSIAASDKKPAQPNIVKVEDLNAPNRVVGKLTVPLGRVVSVEGEIIEGTQPRTKSLDGVLLLQVRSVNGQKLKVPCVLVARWFTTADSKKLKGRVKLVGYESGEFTGVPVDAFSHILPIASEDFHFESFFVVLKSI